MIAVQKDMVARITGVITPEAIDNLEDKIGGIFTILKSTHFAKGQCSGYLVCVIIEEKHQFVIVNNTWMYASPANPGAYAAAALNVGVSAAHQEQMVTNHKEEHVSCTKYIGSQEAGKELILYSVGDDTLAHSRKNTSTLGMQPSSQ
jgi:hypothetical protein